MKPIVELNILAEDIRTFSYLNIDNCAIARACKRAGLDVRMNFCSDRLRLDNKIYSIAELDKKVLGMYVKHYPEYKDIDCYIFIHGPKENIKESLEIVEPQDFTYIVTEEDLI